MLLAAALVFELSRESLTGTHYRYREYVNGLPTENYVWSAEAPPPLFKAEALPPHSKVWLNGRVVRRSVVFEKPFEPYAYDHDAATGALIRRTPLFFRAKPARVFDPNPVVALNDPALQDLNDSASAVPAAAYKDVELNDAALHGPHVTLVDKQARNVAPPAGGLVFDREQDGFEDVSAYFHIDRNQQHLQSLGYAGARAVVPYAIEVDAHAASGADNSFFIPSSTEAGKGTLYYGEGGTDDAEDADLVVHEYAHAIHEWIAPGTFGGAFASEARALAEGVGDYWAYSAHADARRASGRDPYCFADWDARCWQDAASESCGYAEGTDCLRRVDSTKTMADYETNETSGVEHRNGAIWSSALREIHERIGRTVTDTIVIESLFGTPPRPTFAIMAERLLQADRLLYQGAHAGAICGAMFTRGILTQCDTTPRGERTLFQSPTHGVAIPENSAVGVTSTITIDDARAIEAISVRVDIDHPSRGDLFVELTAPDGTKVVLHQLSSSRTADIHATFAVDALVGRSAAGTWTLFVADRRPRDAGTLESWGLEIRFTGDEPVTERPRGSVKLIPVVGHVYGENGSYVSDVRIANATTARQVARLTFTRSGEDGTTSFAMQMISLDAGQTMALDDIVNRTFHTFGTGALAIHGDVLATSRTYVATTNGTLAQQVPARLSFGPDGVPLLVAPFPDQGSRVNFGVAETFGGSGVVRVSGEGWERELLLLPWSHVQFPVPQGLIEARAISGTAAITAYVSQIDAGGDAMFLEARRTDGPRRGCFPAITAQTSGEPEWRSDLWFASTGARGLLVEAIPDGAATIVIPNVWEDVLSRLFHRTVTVAALCTELPADVFGASRIVHGTTTQSVPLLVESGYSQQLLFVDNDESYRTNIGVVSERGVTADVIVYDAAGTAVGHYRIPATKGVSQVSLDILVTNGRAIVYFGIGAGAAYASVIDRRSGDATLYEGIDWRPVVP